MLAITGFIIIIGFLILILFKKLSVITALILVPIIAGLIIGISPGQIGEMSLAGIKQVAPTGVLLMFAVLYFSTMLDAGLFDPVVSFIIRSVKGDPLKVIIGTAILAMIVHLDGDGTATFMIVLSAFLPVYRQLNINPLILPGIVAMSVGPMHLVPWSGTSARAMAVLHADATQLFNPNIPSILAGIAWVLFVAFLFGRKERKRLGVTELNYHPQQQLSDEQKLLRRPKLIVLNAVMTIVLIALLMTGWIPAAVLFMVFAALALVINYPRLAEQQKVLKTHGTNIFFVSGMIFAAGIFSGVLTGSGMIAAMSQALVKLIPAEHFSLLPVATAVFSMPASLFFTPDAYYFGVVPVLTEAASHMGVPAVEIGRASLLGQMTTGFPVSPLTASTFVLIGLAEVELGEHQRFIFKWIWGTTIVMTAMALLTGSIHL